jgi:hypothetical protein
MLVVRTCMVISIAGRRTRQVGQSGLAAGEGGAANGSAHGGRRAGGGAQGARTEECGGHCECVNVCRWISVVLRFGRCCRVEEGLGQHDMNRKQSSRNPGDVMLAKQHRLRFCRRGTLSWTRRQQGYTSCLSFIQHHSSEERVWPSCCMEYRLLWSSAATPTLVVELISSTSLATLLTSRVS